MNKNVFFTFVVGIVACVVPVAAQDFYENCECVDGVLYCHQTEAPSYQYAPLDDYSSPIEETYEPATIQEYQTRDYAPSQTYQASYRPPRSRTSLSDVLRGDFPPELALLLLALLAVALLAMGCALSSDDGVEQEIDATRALTDKLEAAAREADAHIVAFLEKARDGGRDG